MAKTSWVDQDECTGCGLCAQNVPNVFRINDDGKAECYDPGGSSEDDIQQNAVDVCPVACIHWKE